MAASPIDKDQVRAGYEMLLDFVDFLRRNGDALYSESLRGYARDLERASSMREVRSVQKHMRVLLSTPRSPFNDYPPGAAPVGSILERYEEWHAHMERFCAFARRCLR
jgi:hypothetical protein